MMELYTLTMLDNGNMTYQPRHDPELEQTLAAGELPAGHVLVNRLGDPELLHCAVCRREEGSGGYFLLGDGGGLLMAVVAESNLAYALGLGLFGPMVSEARYAADIFENGADDDDDDDDEL